jgi:hypothetical protein
MNLRKTITVGGLAAALAAPIVAVTATPSVAATSYARLYITASWEHPGYYHVVVSGHIHNAPDGTAVGMRLKGDDPWFNDDLGVSRSTRAYSGEFAMEALVWHGTLNEDWEGRDEVFASVSASNGWSASTANVNGYY